MKVIYYADATTRQFKGSSIVSDDYELQANETFEKPNVITEPAKLVGTSWQDATAEEHEAWAKAQQADVLPAAPSEGDKVLNALGLQIAQIKKTQKATAQAINALGLQLAAAKQNVTTDTTK